MNRDEFLAREVMQWHWEIHEAILGWVEYWEGWVASDGKWKASKWNPGESWPQTGMVLKEMEKDGWECSITTRFGLPKCVIFLRPAKDWIYKMAEHDDLREAIANAAARAKGWEG